MIRLKNSDISKDVSKDISKIEDSWIQQKVPG